MRRLAFLSFGFIVALAVVGLIGGDHESATTRWVVAELGTRDGTARDINESGQVVGESYTARGRMRGFLWKSGQMIELGTLGGPASCAVAVNERGHVIGWSDTGRTDTRHAFLWRNGRMIDLGTLGGRISEAAAINERGQIVGSSRTRHALDKTGVYESFIQHAFLWENGRMIDLGTLGGKRSAALDINEHGQIVGWSTVKDTYRNGEPISHAFLYENGKMIDLGVLPGEKESAAVAINERGQVLAYGYSTAFEFDTTPGHNTEYPTSFVWQDGRKTALPEDTFPRALNEQGQVIGETYPGGKTWMGTAEEEDDETFVFTWANGGMRALASGFSRATAVDNNGRVVGFALMATGADEWHYRAFVWDERSASVLPRLHGDAESAAFASNERGQIVGRSGDHAVLWTLKRS